MLHSILYFSAADRDLDDNASFQLLQTEAMAFPGLLSRYSKMAGRGSGTLLVIHTPDIEEDEVALRKTYADRMDEVVPTVEVARYAQMENKIRAAVKFDILLTR